MTDAPGSRRPVLLLMAVSLAAMFVFSFVYRMSNPSLTVRIQTQEPGHGDAGGMSAITGLMARLSENPDDPETLTALGEAFMVIGSWDRAALFLERALEQDPNNVTLLNALAMSRFRLQEHQKAADLLNQALDKDPSNVTAHFNLGVLYKHYLDRAQDSRPHFKAVIESPSAEESLKEEAAKELEE